MGGRRVALFSFVVVAVLASACTGSADPATTAPTLGDVTDETEISVDGDTSANPEEAGTDTDDVAVPDSVPPEPVSIEAERGDAIERLLVSYTEAINDRRAEEAYELFTEALRERVPLDDLVDGTSTSFISRLSVAQVVFDDLDVPDAATVIASFRTDQAPELGRDGQSCSIWELEYRVLDLGGDVDAPGDWRIDQATPLGGSPFPCPVIAPEPDQPEQTDPVPPGEKPIVHLTLDDGPGPETERFLDLFAEFDVGATFFVNSNRIAGREGVVQRVVADGHAIANHTHSHCNLANPNALTPSALCGSRTAEAEIEDAQRIISAATGITPTCFAAVRCAEQPDEGADRELRPRQLVVGHRHERLEVQRKQR